MGTLPSNHPEERDGKATTRGRIKQQRSKARNGHGLPGFILTSQLGCAIGS